uniref:RING-type domain-containing protein n=1 Tax=Oryza nivara TaxID=4536 RepID=A0A0E0FHR4_ORYNI
MVQFCGTQSIKSAAGATDHSRIVTDSEYDTSAAAGNSHVVIDIDDDDGGVGDSDDSACSSSSAEGPCCAVCMEPLEWVAVGPCGHAVVCSVCAARIRSSRSWQPDLRCCICRAHCPFVVVTRAAAAAAPAAMPAVNSYQEWRARGYYWYCTTMLAYFDDVEQYRATRAIARGEVKGGAAVDVDGNDGGGGGRRTLSSCVDVFRFLLIVAIFALFGLLFGSVFSSLTAGGRATPGDNLAFISACAALWLYSIVLETIALQWREHNFDGGVGHSQAIDDIPQFYASSCSATAYHSHAMEMSRFDASGRGSSRTAADDKGGHVVIDIDAADDIPIPFCVVCMEPLEWVAVGPCGHRVVCSACAARVRSAPYSDHRCCTCRTPCPTVFVTKAAAAAADGELNYLLQLQGDAGSLQDGRVGEYWYLAPMSAYFDDERQYEAAAASSLMMKHQRPPPDADGEFQPRHGGDRGDGALPGDEFGAPELSFLALFFAACGAVVGLGFTGFGTGWGQKVAIVLGSAGIYAPLGTSIVWFMNKNGYCRVGLCRAQIEQAYSGITIYKASPINSINLRISLVSLTVTPIRRSAAAVVMADLDANSGSGVSVAVAVAAASSHSHVIDMPQLDASSRTVAAASATDHSRAVETTRIRTSCSAGDDDKCSTGSDDIPSCAVCMEPLEWVAVGPCGHRVVCPACAARVRSAPKPDHLCCICRTLCPTVLVTKAAAAADGELPFSEMPATTQDGQVGEYWYCAAMSAYFDDERQYEATAKAAAAAAAGCLKQRPAGADNDDGERDQRYGTAQFLKYSFFAALFGVCIGFVFAVDAPGWGGRVGIVAGSAALSVAVGSVLWFLRNREDLEKEQPFFPGSVAHIGANVQKCIRGACVPWLYNGSGVAWLVSHLKVLRS